MLFFFVDGYPTTLKHFIQLYRTEERNLWAITGISWYCIEENRIRIFEQLLIQTSCWSQLIIVYIVVIVRRKGLKTSCGNLYAVVW